MGIYALVGVDNMLHSALSSSRMPIDYLDCFLQPPLHPPPPPRTPCLHSEPCVVWIFHPPSVHSLPPFQPPLELSHLGTLQALACLTAPHLQCSPSMMDSPPGWAQGPPPWASVNSTAFGVTLTWGGVTALGQASSYPDFAAPQFSWPWSLTAGGP